MKNLIYFLLIFIFSIGYSQSGCMDEIGCNYNPTAIDAGIFFIEPVVTSNNMTIGLNQYSQNNLMNNDQIGVFILNELGDYYCVGLGFFNGQNTALTVWGDDPTTTDIQDGCYSGETIYFFDLLKKVCCTTNIELK